MTLSSSLKRWKKTWSLIELYLSRAEACVTNLLSDNIGLRNKMQRHKQKSFSVLLQGWERANRDKSWPICCVIFQGKKDKPSPGLCIYISYIYIYRYNRYISYLCSISIYLTKIRALPIQALCLVTSSSQIFRFSILWRTSLLLAFLDSNTQVKVQDYTEGTEGSTRT